MSEESYTKIVNSMTLGAWVVATTIEITNTIEKIISIVVENAFQT